MTNNMILRMIRQESKDQKISMKRLCYGICDASYLTRCIKKDIEVDKLMLDALLQRLGISTRRYTFILRDSEYSYFELREQTRNHLWQGEIEQAEDCIEQYLMKQREMKGARHLHYQAALLLRSYVMSQKQETYEAQLHNVEEALACTDMRLEELDIEENSYSEIELLLILRGAMILAQMKKTDRAMQIYEQLYSLQKMPVYKDNEFAHIFAKVNYQMAKYYLSKADYTKVMEIADFGVKMLADANKLLYMWELMEMYLKADAKITNSNEVSKNQEVFENHIAIKSVVEEYYKNWSADTHCPMYYEYEIYSLRKIIAQRRKLIGETQESLSRKNNCDYATIERLERGLNDTQTGIRYQLLNAVGLPIEKCFYMLITDNMGVRRDYFNHMDEMEKGNIDEAKELLEKVKRSVDLSITINKQAIASSEFEIEKGENKWSLEMQLKKELQILDATLPKRYLDSSEGGLLYGNEGDIVWRIIINYEKRGNVREAIDLASKVLAGYKKPRVIGDEFISVSLGFARMLESMLANIGDFEQADALVKENLYKCIQHDMAGLLVFWLFDAFWNKEKHQKKITRKDIWLLDTAIVIAAVKGYQERQDFIRRYKEKVISNLEELF